MTLDFGIEEKIRQKVGTASFMIITCDITNSESNEELWIEIDEAAADLKKKYQINEINKRVTIAATRTAYKQCGKDPNRYRPAAEALSRRILKGLSLFRVDTVVDLINMVSFVTGYSIGGFDTDKIEGGRLTLGIGKAGEPYEGIGRGELNVEGLPIWRDAKGGIGTPTSDNERTKLSLSTTKLLIVINAYSGNEGLKECFNLFQYLLEKYANATNIEKKIIEI